MVYWRLQVNNQKPIRLHVAINSLLRTYVNARVFKCSNVAWMTNTWKCEKTYVKKKIITAVKPGMYNSLQHYFKSSKHVKILSKQTNNEINIQGLQILLMSGVSMTSASQILESFWNMWSQVSDFPARGPGMYTLSWGIHEVAVAVRWPGKLKSMMEVIE